MSLTRKIAKHTVWYGAAQVAVMAASVVSLPVLTRNLSTAQYGLLAIVGITVHLCSTLFSGGLRHALARFYSQHKKEAILSEATGTYLTCTLGLGALGTVAAAGIFLVLARLGFLPEWVLPAALLAAPLVFIRLSYQGLTALYRMREWVVRFNLFELANKYLGLVLCLGFVVFVYPSVFQYFRGLFLGEMAVLAVLLALFVREARGFRFGVSRRVAGEMFRYGLPLMAGSVATLLFHMGDRYVIKGLLDARQVALYSVGAQLASYACVAIVSGFEYALVPVIMNAWGAGERRRAEETLGNLVRYYALAAFPMALGLVAVRAGAIRLMTTPEYLGAAPVVPLVVGAAILRGFQTPLTLGLHFAKKTGIIAGLSAAMALLNIGLNIVLMTPWGFRLGIVGAGIATLTCTALYVLIGHLLARKHYHLVIPWRELTRYGVAAGVMFLCVTHLRLDHWLHQLLARIGVGAAVYVVAVLVLDRTLRVYLREHLGRRSRR